MACAAHEMALDPRVMGGAARDGCAPAQSGVGAGAGFRAGAGCGGGVSAGGNDARLYFGSALEDVCATLVHKKKLGRDPSLGALAAGDVREGTWHDGALEGQASIR